MKEYWDEEKGEGRKEKRRRTEREREDKRPSTPRGTSSTRVKDKRQIRKKEKDREEEGGEKERDEKRSELQIETQQLHNANRQFTENVWSLYPTVELKRRQKTNRIVSIKKTLTN